MPNLRDAVRNGLNDNSVVESFRMFKDKYGTLKEAGDNKKEWNSYFKTFYASMGFSEKDAFEILNKV